MLPTLQPLALNSLAQALSKPVKAFNIAPTRTEISFSNRTTSFLYARVVRAENRVAYWVKLSPLDLSISQLLARAARTL